MSTANYFYANPLHPARPSQPPGFAEIITPSQPGRTTNTVRTLDGRPFGAV
ncbi:MAG: hypothetical protein WBQ03_15125 [Candidatus Sulfotelmatobacter sp.]